MDGLQKCKALDKLFYEFFPEGESYDMIAQHYGEVMGAALTDDAIAICACDLLTYFLGNPSAEELDGYYQTFYDEALGRFGKETSGKQAAKRRVREILDFQVRLGLLNLVMDNGKFFDAVMNEIKATYKDKWLEVISAADKANLSIDGTKNKASEAAGQYADCVNKYLVLKKWKDKLHYLYMATIESQVAFVNKYLQVETNPYEAFFTLIKHLLTKKYERQVANIEEIAFLTRGYFFSFVRQTFGGKAFGLALLKQNGFRIPETYVAGINCEQVNFSFFPADKRYAVRSSADIEDGDKHSFAGMFDSFLDVGADEIGAHVQKVKESVHSQRLNSYISRLNLSEPHMAVVIQEYRECEFAGVWLGRDLEAGGLEWVRGNGEKLVSGDVTPNMEAFGGDAGECEHLTVGGTVIAAAMLEAQNTLYRQTGKLADIEWCVCGGELIFLQYRSVTAQVDLASAQAKSAASGSAGGIVGGIVGVACSKGKVTGRAKFVQNPEALTEWDAEDILLVIYTSPEWVTLMLKAKAIVTCYGGFFSHAGIIAREFGIPCVSGIGNRSQELDGHIITVDGSTGKITVVD